MNLYSYVVVHDTGFAPNPFSGFCTLACCKPAIRRAASLGDWIVGLTTKAAGSKIVYFMRVDDIAESYADYWADPRFAAKKPMNRRDRGDNIYEPLSNGGHRQLPSMHSNGQIEDEDRKNHDLSGRRVLISNTFAYFGRNALPLPLKLRPIVPTRGHRCKFSDELKQEFLRFTRTSKFGIHGTPVRWPAEGGMLESDCACTPCD